MGHKTPTPADLPGMNVPGPEVSLYTHSGGFVARVKILPTLRPFEVVVWGERFFILRADGRYTEADGMTAALLDTTDIVAQIGTIETDDAAPPEAKQP